MKHFQKQITLNDFQKELSKQATEAGYSGLEKLVVDFTGRKKIMAGIEIKQLKSKPDTFAIPPRNFEKDKVLFSEEAETLFDIFQCQEKQLLEKANKDFEAVKFNDNALTPLPTYAENVKSSFVNVLNLAIEMANQPSEEIGDFSAGVEATMTISNKHKPDIIDQEPKRKWSWFHEHAVELAFVFVIIVSGILLSI